MYMCNQSSSTVVQTAVHVLIRVERENLTTSTDYKYDSHGTGALVGIQKQSW